LSLGSYPYYFVARLYAGVESGLKDFA
jgi:hypothetical protein